ncbi:HYC_CC_PP family protein [Imperialibacter roseus]
MQPFRKIFAILFSCIVLLSSMSFTINTHLCGGRVESVAFFVDASACSMNENPGCASDNHNPGGNLKRSDCCSDFSQLVEAQTDMKSTMSVDIPASSYATQVVFTSLFLAAERSSQRCSNEYVPPLIDRDIQVLVQSFLI